jgi:hypothetical protein
MQKDRPSSTVALAVGNFFNQRMHRHIISLYNLFVVAYKARLVTEA